MKKNALTIRSPSSPPPLALAFTTSTTLSKRTLAFPLPNGWWFILSREDEYAQVYTAITALTRFYTITLSKLNLPPNLDLQVPTLKLSETNGPFQLFFHLQANALLDHVPMALVRVFVQNMLGRVERAWPAEYRGWLRGPGPVAIEVVLRTTGAVMQRSDSAMDFHDNGT
ncbi:MAG: hypothetical protein Q9202_001926 [Teloschistes flavicans]